MTGHGDLPQAAIDAAQATYSETGSLVRALRAARPHLAAAEREGHEHQWTRCPNCLHPDQPCACSGVPCCEGERRENEAYAGGAAAERERLYAELGNDHYAIFTADRWTIEHSVECRLGGHMHECGYHAAVALNFTEYDPGMAGRWRITGYATGGRPCLERAERAS